MAEALRIDRLGHRGDGVASGAAGPVFVAGALPGELVEAELFGERGKLLRVVEPSPDRVEPYCPEVGVCGGCATQHLRQSTALVWKRDLLEDAFRRERVEIEGKVADCVDAHGAGRRRATFHARFGSDGALSVGFSEPRGHTVISIESCPLLAPSMRRALPAARAVAAAIASRRKPLDLAVTATDAGLDMDVRGSGPVPEPMRLKLVDLAGKLDLARLAIHGDVVVERRRPTLVLGRATMTPPPGGFLQATAEGEAVLAALAGDAIGRAKRIADLFCGAGAFALRLAERAEVHAADADRPAVESLAAASRMAQGLKRITTETRDLFRRPLTPAELSRFDAVVFDPPRAGAEAQARALAGSKVKTVVAVSCNPTTLARDASILAGGGYVLKRVTPVDQFRHSAHVESVAVFERS